MNLLDLPELTLQEIILFCSSNFRSVNHETKALREKYMYVNMKLRSVYTKSDNDQNVVNQLFLDQFYINCEKYGNKINHVYVDGFCMQYQLNVQPKKLTVAYRNPGPCNINSLTSLEKLTLGSDGTYLLVENDFLGGECLKEINGLPNLVDLNMEYYRCTTNVLNLSKLKKLNIKCSPDSTLKMENLMSLKSLCITFKNTSRSNEIANDIWVSPLLSVKDINPDIENIQITGPNVYTSGNSITRHLFPNYVPITFIVYVDMSNIFSNSVGPCGLNLKHLDITTRSIDPKLLEAIKSKPHSIKEVEYGLTHYKV